MHRYIFITVVSFLVFGLCFSLAAYSGSNIEYTEKTVVVEKGDSLWDIAQTHCQNQGNIRKTIYMIKKLNNMDSATVFPGQEITIPVISQNHTGDNNLACKAAKVLDKDK